MVPSPTLPLSFTLRAGLVGSAPKLRILSAGMFSLPTTISLAPGVFVPIPTFPELVERILNPLSIQLLLPVEPVGTCQVALPSASEVSTAPGVAPALTCKLVALIRPSTCNRELGAVVPIPTLPSSLTLIAGFIGLEPS